ncbi:MAG TPA: SGNH/GDSL hydrolase family protein [Pirellulales bacterium]|nr:SGNH/GDSL hydrolase family protein [Pirellulales bacterium]
MKRRRKILFAALAATLSTVAITVIVAGGTEVALRSVDKPPNDYTTVTWGQRVRKNSLGFREREVTAKAAGVYRIMVLGDSLTWGAGLAERERYTWLLQLHLQAKLNSQDIEVLNFALPGAPTTHERDVLLKHIDATAPDLVVVGWCMNDTQPRDQDWCPEREVFNRKLDRLRAIGLKEVAGKAYYLGPDWIDALDRTYQPGSPEWQAFESALADIAAACRERSLPAPVLALLIQGNGDFANPDRHLSKVLEWSRKSATSAERSGFITVSMEAAFRAEGSRNRWVNPWDGHPDAQCNRVYAEELAKAAAPIITKGIQLRTKTASKCSSIQRRPTARTGRLIPGTSPANIAK